MKILLQNGLGEIPQIHEMIFGEEFPYTSYDKKCLDHKLYNFGYYDDDKLVGYSIIVDQKEQSDLYAWYGGLLPEYQGRNITIQMFDTLVEKARELGRDSISLATTNGRPNMIRLAVKYGFEIVDLKKRDFNEGNKIYFKFWVHEPTEITVSLNEKGTKKRPADLEQILVKAYRTNCVRINLTKVRDAEDMKTVGFVMSYCKGFVRKMDVKVLL